MEEVSPQPEPGGFQGFKRASNDFSFMKRKVRVNAVDKDIKEY